MKALRNLTLTPRQKRILIAGSVALAIITAVMFFSATVPAAVAMQATATPTNTSTPVPTNTPTPTFIATGLPNPAANGFLQYLICGEQSYGRITPGACLQIYNGSDIEVFSQAGARTWYLDGETGSTSGGQGLGNRCVRGQQSVIGAATVIPATLTAAGITTPSWAMHSMAGDIGNTHHSASHSNASGVVTLKVWNNMLSGTVTPQAATTTVAIDYEVCGN